MIHPDLIVQAAAAGIVVSLSAIVLARRVARARRSDRGVLAAMYGFGILVVVVIEATAVILSLVVGVNPLTVFEIQIVALAAFPLGFALAVLRGEFARAGEIEELGAWLGAESAGRANLRDVLADALGDATVRLLFWRRETEWYVDAARVVEESPALGSGRGAAEIELAGDRVGAIAYDAVLIAEPEVVRAAGRVIALALERERLTAELLASDAALRESRARIVAAADQERRRIARDLHDGLQGRLVLLAIHAGRIADDPAAPETLEHGVALRVGLTEAGDQLRTLVQGVMPALLIERGLAAATEDLVDRLPIPTRLELGDLDHTLPETVQSAGYFVIAEALTNAVKHSHAQELGVRVRREDSRLRIEVRDDGIGGARLDGSRGLRGIADRLDAPGGRLWVTSPPGQGTVVHAEMPCGS